MTRALLYAGSRLAGLCALLIGYAPWPLLAIVAFVAVGLGAGALASVLIRAMGGAW